MKSKTISLCPHCGTELQDKIISTETDCEQVMYCPDCETTMQV